MSISILLPRTNIVCVSLLNYIKHIILHPNNRLELHLFYFVIGRVTIHFSHKLGLQALNKWNPLWLQDVN
jgi:hypothetical protein